MNTKKRRRTGKTKPMKETPKIREKSEKAYKAFLKKEAKTRLLKHPDLGTQESPDDIEEDDE